MFPRWPLPREGSYPAMIYGEYDKLQLLPSEIWLMKGGLFSDVERELLHFLSPRLL